MSTRKNTSQPEKRDKFMNNGSEVGMYSATDESFTVPLCRDRKIRTALRTNQISGFVTVSSEKKIIRHNIQNKLYR